MNFNKISYDENIGDSPPKKLFKNLNKSCDLSTNLSNGNQQSNISK